MKNPVYKQIELTGTSSESVEAAIQNAVKRAHKTLKNLCWFEVVETRGRLSKGKIEQWQVSIKVGFALEN